MFWFGEWEFCQKPECREDESIVRLENRFFAIQWLRQCKGDFLKMFTMRALLLQSVAREPSRMSDDAVIDEIADRILSHRLHIHGVAIRDASGLPGPVGLDRQSKKDSKGSRGRAGDGQDGQGKKTPPPVPPTDPSVLHWIELELLKLPDDQPRPKYWAPRPSAPYAGERYAAEITDGHKDGSLDSKGDSKYKGIPQGSGVCEYQFKLFYKDIEDLLGPPDTWPAAAPPPPPVAKPQPTAVPKITVSAPKIVLVRRDYQDKLNPKPAAQRLSVQLGLDGDYDGVGDLTSSQADTIRVFETADGKDVKALPWSIPAADLKAGKTIYIEAAKPSPALDGTVLTLTLSGGSLPVKQQAATDKLTCVQLQLDIYKPRPDDGSDPAIMEEAKKYDPGRYVVIHDPANHLFTQRAMLVVAKAQPADFKGKLVLKPLTAGVEVYAGDKEVPASGQTALTGDGLKFANGDIDAAKGTKLWVQGKTKSGALADTGWTVELEDVPGKEGDRVTMTVVSITLVKIQTTDITNAAAWEEDDDFSPRLGEKAKIQVKIEPKPATFTGKLRIDFGRLNNHAKGANPLVNGAFTLVSRVEKDVPVDKDTIDFEWDGNSTVDVAQEFSDRTTPNVNGGAAVHLPLPSIASGQPIPHGLYFIDQIGLVQDSGLLGRLRPDNIDLSVPILANLTYNGNWPTDLQAFGLAPFQANIETALLRFGGRDYMIRDATLANRINVRFIANAAITNGQSIRSSVGGPDPAAGGLFGSTPDGPAPLSDNIYTFNEGLSQDITIFPSTFLLFNNTGNVADQTTFRAVFAPLGVAPAQTDAAPGTATARAVDAAGAVTGACTAADDQTNVTVNLDVNGMATVATTNAALVPAARASAIQAALQAFVHFLGNTINHETAHGLGVASRVRAENSITIAGATVTSPLDGDAGAHNKVTNNTNIVDAGGTRSFVRRIEAAGNPQQTFSATNTQYLRDCIPFDRHDN